MQVIYPGQVFAIPTLKGITYIMRVSARSSFQTRGNVIFFQLQLTFTNSPFKNHLRDFLKSFRNLEKNYPQLNCWYLKYQLQKWSYLKLIKLDPGRLSFSKILNYHIIYPVKTIFNI